jgi:hypothetical protein
VTFDGETALLASALLRTQIPYGGELRGMDAERFDLDSRHAEVFAESRGAPTSS